MSESKRNIKTADSSLHVGDAGRPLAKGHRDPKAKLDHIEACLSSDSLYHKSTGFERWEFENQALPEVSLQDIELSTELAGKRVNLPLMIAPMTGGSERAAMINRRLARCAERHGLAMGVGSQRIAIENADVRSLFELRRYAPTIPLFANFGAAQLSLGWGESEAREAVEMIDADALFIHLNPMQEAIQGGDQDFRGVTDHLTRLCSSLARDDVPVFVREVCFGMSESTTRTLIDCGVAGIDCAGAGGTSWAKVEGLVAKTERRQRLGLEFGEWGIPTATSIMNVRAVDRDIPLIATGGITSGQEVAKAIALGADVCAMARTFLENVVKGEAAVDALVASVSEELRLCMFGTGAADIDALSNSSALKPVE